LGLTDWSSLAESGFRVISFDARGHGDSSGEDDPESYLWTSLAEDLLAIIEHFSPDGPVSAVGVSMGTATILHALTRAPDRFAAIVLGAPPTAWETRAAQSDMYEQLAQAAGAMSQGDFAALLAGAPVAPIFADLGGYPSEMTPPYRLLPSVFRGAGRSDLPEISALASIDVPALILAWDTDPGHPVATSEHLDRTLPNSQLHVSTTVADIHTWPARAAEFFAAH
jgi:pimeloyl-ACP methyl ester carboxylesterase